MLRNRKSPFILVSLIENHILISPFDYQHLRYHHLALDSLIFSVPKVDFDLFGGKSSASKVLNGYWYTFLVNKNSSIGDKPCPKPWTYFFIEFQLTL